MPEDTPAPVFSSRKDDPSAQEAVDLFVVTLAEQVDALQDAELEKDLDLLRALAEELGARATELGYDALSTLASVVADAGRDGKVEDAEAAMVELTQMSCRIRMGHRGAA